MATATTASHVRPFRAGNRHWSLRIACAAAIGVVVAAAAANARGLADAPTEAADADEARPTPSATSSVAARSPTSTIAFPTGNRTTEGRWSSACSLTCILPGVNATRTVLDEPFQFGADVCVAHVGDAAATMGPGNATLVDYGALSGALWTMFNERGSGANRWPAPVVTYKPHAAQEGAQPHCPAGSRLVNGQPWWPGRPNLLTVAKDDAVDGGRQLVEDEAMIFGALAMGRNVLGGRLQRQVGVYDLVAATVHRLGVCVDMWCNSVVAVDTTRPSVPVARCANGLPASEDSGIGNRSTSPLAGCPTIDVNMPIITHLARDGIERPVSMVSSDLLALGRGMLGSPKWFENATKSFHLGGQLIMRGPTPEVPRESKMGMLSKQDGIEVATWDLNGSMVERHFHLDSTNDFAQATPTSTPFLSHIATILCAGKLRSFIASSSACAGVRPWGRVRRRSASADIQGNIMDAGVWAGAGKVEWWIRPKSSTPDAADNATATHHPPPYQRPGWTSQEIWYKDTTFALEAPERVQVTPPELAGRATREVNPTSAVEAELAASLFQLQLLLPAASGAGHTSTVNINADAVGSLLSAATPGLDRALDRFSHAYDRRVFQAEHPAPPVSSADLVLSIIVVVPELGALLCLLLTTKRWGRSALLGFWTIVLIGAVSISGVIALVSQEAVGAEWRARSTRTATHALYPAGDPVDEFGDPNLVGTLVVVEQSFLLLAPTMYRPAWVQLVAAGTCGAYVVVVAAMAARVLFVARQQRRARRARAEASPRTDTEEAIPGARRSRRRPHACASCMGGSGSSGSEDDIESGGQSASAGTCRGRGVDAAVSEVRAWPWPVSAGGVYYLPRWGVGGGGGWA